MAVEDVCSIYMMLKKGKIITNNVIAEFKKSNYCSSWSEDYIVFKILLH